jgi:hypothetical protein
MLKALASWFSVSKTAPTRFNIRLSILASRIIQAALPPRVVAQHIGSLSYAFYNFHGSLHEDVEYELYQFDQV